MTEEGTTATEREVRPGDVDDDPYADDLDELDEPTAAVPDASPALPILPSMVGRIDSVHGTVNALALRLEALIAATGSLRTTVTDRVDEYASTVGRLSLTQARDLDEYRRSSERVVAELRRSVDTNDEALHRFGARLDELANDIAALGEVLRTAAGDARAAAERPAGPTTASVEALRAAVEALPDQLAQDASRDAGAESLRQELLGLRRSILERLERAVADIADRTSSESASSSARLADLATDVADLRQLLHGLPAIQSLVAGIDVAVRARDEQQGDVAAALAAVSAEVAQLRAGAVEERRALTELLGEVAAAVRPLQGVPAVLASVDEGLGRLRADTPSPAELRALVQSAVQGAVRAEVGGDLHAIGERLDALGGGLDQLRVLVAAAVDALPSSAEGSAAEDDPVVTALDGMREELLLARDDLTALRRRAVGRPDLDVEALTERIVARLTAEFELAE